MLGRRCAEAMSDAGRLGISVGRTAPSVMVTMSGSRTTLEVASGAGAAKTGRAAAREIQTITDLTIIACFKVRGEEAESRPSAAIS